MPRFSHDPYVNFCVLEALVQRGERDREDAEERKEEEDFRKSHKGWDPDDGP
jgi:hypothetical protein